MRLLTTLIFTVLVSFANANVYYVSPSGSDGNAGTFASPKFNLSAAWSLLSAGDTLYMRGGTYSYTIMQNLTGKNGISGNLIKVWAYPGESPKITKGGSWTRNVWHRGALFFTGNYFHWKGIEIYGFPNIDGNIESAIVAYDCNNNIYEQLVIHDNHSGMYAENSGTGNLWLNCDFYNNYDAQASGGNSDGLDLAYMTAGTSSNTIRGCRFWNNGDDGLDTFENSGYVLIDSCWAWHNGYVKGTSTAAGDGVGFKLGSDFLTTPAHVGVVKRRLQRSMAWDNRNAGAHINEADFSTEIYNNTFYANSTQNFNFHYNNRVHYFKNNISFGSPWDVARSTNSTTESSSYGVSGYADVTAGWTNNASTEDFVSVSWVGADGARQSNGSLPSINFLKLAVGSDLIDAGTVISGIGYNGSLPDRGANESGTQSQNTGTPVIFFTKNTLIKGRVVVSRNQ